MNGVENMLYMKSVSGNDGSYSLSVYFAVGTNADINTVNVQNRVSLAEPKIPLDVRKQGLTVKKQSPALLQMIAVYSPDRLPRRSVFVELHDHQHTRPACPHSWSRPGTALRCRKLQHAHLVLHGRADKPEHRTQRRRQCYPDPERAGRRRRIGAAPMPGDQSCSSRCRRKAASLPPRSSAASSFAPIPMAPLCSVTDVARLELGAQSSDTTGRLNGGPDANIGIFQSPGSNAVATARKTA